MTHVDKLDGNKSPLSGTESIKW